MSVLNKLACALGHRDEVPNQELAKELVLKNDWTGIKEIVDNLWNKDKNIANDCIKTLYEAGSVKPEFIEDFAEDIARLLKENLSGSNNRMVWGAMITLAVIAGRKADVIMEHFELIKKAIESGSVITIDNGIKALSQAAAAGPEYNKKIFPYLTGLLKTCRPKSVAQYSESIFTAVNQNNKNDLVMVLKDRMGILTPSQKARVQKLLKKIG